MKYKCPSCKMCWEDDIKPLEKLTQPLCIFCSTRHTQKELLNWQMDHIKSISKEDHALVLRHFYRYVESELKLLKGEQDGKKEGRGKSECW